MHVLKLALVYLISADTKKPQNSNRIYNPTKNEFPKLLCNIYMKNHASPQSPKSIIESEKQIISDIVYVDSVLLINLCAYWFLWRKCHFDEIFVTG